MNLLFRVLFSFKSHNTHQKIVLDALRMLDIERISNDQITKEDLNNFINLFLIYHEELLSGAIDPDIKFKDYKNHVIYVWDNFWGGTHIKTKEWYQKFVQHLKNQEWKEATYALGVMSHYFTDSVQPMHTGQIEGEGRIHRWVEIAVWKRYNELQWLIENKYGGFPYIKIANKKDWIDWIVKKSARFANHHYEYTLKHYKVEEARKAKDPRKGMDDELVRVMSFMIGHSVSALAEIIERGISEAGVKPPKTSVFMNGLRLIPKIPNFITYRKELERKEFEILEAMENEYDEKGKVSETMPEQDKTIRILYAKEVRELEIEDLKFLLNFRVGRKFSGNVHIKRVLWPKLKKQKLNPNSEIAVLFAKKIKRIPTKSMEAEASDYAYDWDNIYIPEKPKPVHGYIRSRTNTPLEREYYLMFDDPVEKVPEMKKSVAKRLRELGIETAHHFIVQKPEELVKKMRIKWMTPEIIDRMQNEALMMTHLPKLRAYHAKLLYLAGYTSIYRMQEATVDEIYENIQKVLKTKKGKRALQTGKPPTKELISKWMEEAVKYHVI